MNAFSSFNKNSTWLVHEFEAYKSPMKGMAMLNSGHVKDCLKEEVYYVLEHMFACGETPVGIIVNQSIIKKLDIKIQGYKYLGDGNYTVETVHENPVINVQLKPQIEEELEQDSWPSPQPEPDQGYIPSSYTPSPEPKTIMVDLFKRFADVIQQSRKIPVILGRDAWPLIPLLRDRGIFCVYQMISRLNKDFHDTYDLYFEETMPYSLVVDTGYVGSIIQAIRERDRTVSGLLMSSTGEFPELNQTKRDSIVDTIEHMPKLVGRAKHHKGTKIICHKPGDEDNDNVAAPHEVIQQNTELLLELGCSVTTAIQYARFTGVTREQRIGLKGEALTNYLDEVATFRRTKHFLVWEEEVKIAITAAFDYGQSEHLATLAKERPTNHTIRHEIIKRWRKLDEDIHANLRRIERDDYLDQEHTDFLIQRKAKLQERWKRYYRVTPRSYINDIG